MRTTLTLADDVLTQAKEQAARSGKTVSQVVEDSLRDAFARRSKRLDLPVVLPTFPGDRDPASTWMTTPRCGT